MGRRKKKPSNLMLMNCPGAVMAEVSPAKTIFNTLSLKCLLYFMVKIDCFKTYLLYYASMVEMHSVVSSKTSSNTFTVSNAVNIVTLFSTAH